MAETTRTQLVQRLSERMEALQARHKSTDPMILRLAALALAPLAATDADERVSAAAAELKAVAKFSGPLSGGLRFVLAAMMVRRELDPVTTVEETRDLLSRFKSHGLSRGGAHAFLAAFLLVLVNDGQPVADQRLQRMAELIALWKEDHRWLTGQDDYPMAALHAARDEDLCEVSKRTETIYKELVSKDFSKGNQLQLVSHLLAIMAGAGLESAVAFAQVAEALKARGEKAPQSRYDEVAMLTLVGLAPETCVDEALAAREEILAIHAESGWWKRLTAGIPSENAFSMAVAIVMAAHPPAHDLGATEETATLAMAQAVLEAQQAAMIACMAAISVSVSTAAAATAN
jgi:hypothetical protein